MEWKTFIGLDGDGQPIKFDYKIIKVFETGWSKPVAKIEATNHHDYWLAFWPVEELEVECRSDHTMTRNP